MSIDVTFHPIRDGELRYYVLDIGADGGLATTRAIEAVEDDAKQDALIGLYEALAAAGADAASGAGSIAMVVHYGAAVAGYLHPYWYARGAGVWHLAEDDPELFGGLLAPLAAVASEDEDGAPLVAAVDGEIPFGAGYIPHDRLDALEDALDGDGADLAEAVLGSDGLTALLAAIRYASLHSCGLLETADVVALSEEENISDPANLRAPHLDNAEDFANARTGLRRH